MPAKYQCDACYNLIDSERNYHLYDLIKVIPTTLHGVMIDKTMVGLCTECYTIITDAAGKSYRDLKDNWLIK